MRLPVVVVGLLLASPFAKANGVAIAFSRPDNSHATIELRHVASVADLSATPAIVREMSLASPLLLDLSPGTWAIDVRSATLWHAQQTFTVAGANTDVTANLWPVAILRGRVAIEDTKTIDLRATFAPSQPGAMPGGTVTCTVADGQFNCRLPAGTLDVRLRVRGYVTKFFWSQQLAADAPSDVGTLRFMRGAVLLGRVEIAPDAIVQLRDLRIAATPANSDAAAHKVAIATRAETRGFFHIDGLAPGKYAVTAAGGKYRSRTLTVVVLPGLTAELRDVLRVESPKTLRVLVRPPLDPMGHPWHVTLWQFMSENHIESIAGSHVSASGEWAGPKMYAAPYQLTVEADDGSTWYRDVVQIGDADLIKTVDLGQQHIQALITLGGKPLRGSVTLTGGPSSITFETDEGGQWRGVIPVLSEDWAADVASDTPPVRRTIRGLRPKRVADSDDAALTIDLPLNVITGVVVGKNGERIEHAQVRISGEDALQSIDTDPDGGFFVAGLAAGAYRISASAFLLESPAVEVAVEASSVPDPLRLVLDDVVKIHGRVMSDFGAVSGAQVIVSATNVLQTIAMVNVTDEKGEFSTTAAPSASEINVFVAAPGFALKFFHTHLREGTLIVPVDQRGGALTVSAPHARERPYLVHNGMWYPADALLGSAFAYQEGEQIIVPAIDAGAYSLCMATNAEASAAERGIALGRLCRSAFLAQYGSLAFESSPRKGAP